MLNVPGARAAAPPRPRKVLLYCWVSRGFSVLVPKQRGTGYLKIPYWHNNNTALNKIADSVRCDVSGLDGALDFEGLGLSKIFHGSTEHRAAFAAIVMPQLEAHYLMDSREVDTVDYWANHPTL